MLISIITVTFNAAGVIQKTLSSLTSQTFRDFEFLVIDGASSDSTLSLVQAAEIPNTRILSEPDRGLYDAMNKGLALAKGRYILFLNAGDSFANPDTLENYARAAVSNPDIIYGDTIIVNLLDKKIADRHLSVPQILTKNSFSRGMLICHQAFMVRKDLAPLFDLTYRFSADYDWTIKCIANSSPNKCANLNQVTVRYLSDGLTDKNKGASLRERFRIMRVHYGLPLTLLRHFSFIFRAIRRGKI